MPSWNDGSSSSQSLLGDLTDLDYAPDTCEDPTFGGLAVGCEEVCRVHRLEPVKCVAFEGTNTGRKFYVCSVQNEVNNCGFVSWLDGEWPETLQNALNRLWGMYHSSNSARIDDKIEHAKFVEELAAEKNKAEKKYSSLLDDVHKFTTEAEKRVVEENYHRIKENSEEDLGEMKKESNLLKNEVEVLKNEVGVLKQVQKSQAEIMKARQKKWDDEREAMKEEKKKLEYMLFDLLKVSDGNKDKMKRIKAICDE